MNKVMHNHFPLETIVEFHSAPYVFMYFVLTEITTDNTTTTALQQALLQRD